MTVDLVHHRSIDESCRLEPRGDVDTRARWIRAARQMLAGAPRRPITAEQIRTVSIALSRAGINDHDMAIGYIAAITGRVLNSRKQLTSREACVLIALLDDETRTNR